MSRIRSVHPGFFTDEGLVSVSMGARLLFIGLGIEADDKGVFEWKPLTIKMRVFPADNVDVAELLAELVAVDAIRNYEMDARQYGAIRNFRKFQRPKTPNDLFPAPSDIRNYVGLDEPISEIAAVQPARFPPNGETLPPKGEKSPQMEDGGGRRRKEGEAPGEPRATRLSKPFELPDEWRDWALAERRWDVADVKREADTFADFWHAKPGKDGRKLDWLATWRVWVRNSRRPDGAGYAKTANDGLYASAERFQ